MTDETTLSEDRATGHSGAPERLGFVIAWARESADRLGALCIVPATTGAVSFVLGRGSESASDPGPRLQFAWDGPQGLEPCPPIDSPRISRRQLVVRAEGVHSLAIERTGRCRMWHNGEEADAVTALPGDTIRLGSELLLVCVRRPAWKASARGAPPQRSFARPDEDGIVGESPAAVALRENLLFAAPRTEHVLILGQSGTGKELVAQAIHAHSARSGGPFVARNAATLPEGLVDSELFGHARNYPNAGMAERSGLLGAASGGTLFLDEIAELPLQLQSHLLRVMDDGEYQRLGEAAARKVDLRVVAATNRPTALRSDLAARFKITVHTEGLNDRREDIPLILLHLARNLAGSSADLRSRLFGEGDLHGMPELPIEFVDALVRHDYTTHVRELESLLWRHLSGARGSSGTTGQATSPVPARPTNIPREALVAALEANRWSLERTWRALGLGSRHVLSRLMTRHGLSRR